MPIRKFWHIERYPVKDKDSGSIPDSAIDGMPLWSTSPVTKTTTKNPCPSFLQRLPYLANSKQEECRAGLHRLNDKNLFIFCPLFKTPVQKTGVF